ncbi:MAG: hypothetical protein Q7K26_06795 [bacterium]|nr:hypothetical protein [bacterium]
MSTVRTCTTPEEGWVLCNYFIGNLFWAVELLGEVAEADDVGIKRREKIINDTWATLVGNLYVVVRRMESNYHYSDAIRMRLILDMVVELGITEPEARASIRREFHGARISMTGYRW